MQGFQRVGLKTTQVLDTYSFDRLLHCLLPIKFTEYNQVLREAQELQQYYAEQNHEIVARIAMLPSKPGYETAWKKLQAIRAKRKLRA